MEKLTIRSEATGNALVLEREMRWLSELITARLAPYARVSGKPAPAVKPPALVKPAPRVDPATLEVDAPCLEAGDSMYADIVDHYGFGAAERLILILALAPHIRPGLLDLFFIRNAYDRGHTEFGGILGETHGGFIPTGETALFLLCGGDLDSRFLAEPIFGPEHPFHAHSILKLGETAPEEPYLSGPVILSREYKELFTTGQYYRPVFSAHFPARLITTPLDWEDLTLDNTVRVKIGEILTWIRNEELLMNDWGLKRKLKKGYRCLFHGPSGTGKTLTATLLGKVTGRDVYRVDLSMMVSKYIGETEKNLSGLFDQAENKDWILFFDEADALFGKRVEAGNFNDRSANQQIAYLLQRVEDYNGVVILATNFETGIDEAFTRRFESMVHFPLPDADQRLQLWENHFSRECYTLDDPGRLREIAEKYALCGGKIINVLRYGCIKAVQRGSTRVRVDELVQGIRQELHKEGRTT